MDEPLHALFHWRRRPAIAAYLLLKRRNRTIRTIGTCEIFKHRKQQGAYGNLVQEMRLKVEKKFSNYHRMSIKDFDFLLEKLCPIISKSYYAREPISPGEMLSATLRYLAAGVSMKSISYNYSLGMSTVSNIIKSTCSAIWEVLRTIYLECPTEEKWKNIADGFEAKWNFPNCIGAIDGKHIRIQAPPHTGSDFFNYKDFFSIVLLAICDADYCFTVVDIGAKGRQSDGGIFRNSNFGQKFFLNEINIPPPRRLWQDGDPMPFSLVGDAAFPFGINLMRPFPGKYLPQNERIFNYRLSRARRTIENAFGILVSRWRILERPIIAKMELIEKIVEAVVCLHNFLMKRDIQRSEEGENKKYCPVGYADSENEKGDVIEGEWRNEVEHGLPNVGRMGGNAYAQRASEVRMSFSDYFVHIAPIEPQWAKYFFFNYFQ